MSEAQDELKRAINWVMSGTPQHLGSAPAERLAAAISALIDERIAENEKRKGPLVQLIGVDFSGHGGPQQEGRSHD